MLSTSLNEFNLPEFIAESPNEYREHKPFYYHSGLSTHGLLNAEEETAICKSMESDSLALLLILSSSEQGNVFLEEIVVEIMDELSNPSPDNNACESDEEIKLLGLIDDVQTTLYVGDSSSLRNKRRKLMARLARWAPPPYLVYNKLKSQSLQKLDEHSLGAINAASRRYIADRNRMATANLRLVLSISSKYKNLGTQYDDLVQEGYIGLIKAIERFDYRLGYRFSTYAYRAIGQSIHLAVHKNSSLVRKPFKKMKQNRVIERAKGHLEQQLGRRPSLNDVANYVSMPVDTVNRIVVSQEISTIEPKSDTGEIMDYLYSQGDSDETAGNLAENNVDLGFVENAMSGIKKRDRLIVYMRFGIGCRKDHTLEEIATQLGLTKERVRQIVNTSIDKIRHELMPHQYSANNVN